MKSKLAIRLLVALAASAVMLSIGFRVGVEERTQSCPICAYMASNLDMPLLIDAATGVTDILDFPVCGEEPGVCLKFKGSFIMDGTAEETQIIVRDPVDSVDYGTVKATACFCLSHTKSLGAEGVPYGVLFRDGEELMLAYARPESVHEVGGYFMETTMEADGLYLYLLRE